MLRNVKIVSYYMCSETYKDHLGTNKMWSLYTGGLYMQVLLHGKYMYAPGDM